MPRQIAKEPSARHSSEAEFGSGHPETSRLSLQKVLRTFGPSRILGRGSRLVELAIRKKI